MKIIDMRKMTTTEMLEGHRELWFWLADNPKARKTDWPGWKNCRNNDWDCFPCSMQHGCCPFDWGTVSCLTPGSLYERWQVETNPVVREVLADLIATLPLREES